MNKASERDILHLTRSLKTLAGYVEMCKAGRIEFALDIPTQIFKIFFDRSIRNNKTTLFERVCGEKIITFHPFCFRLAIVMENGSIRSWCPVFAQLDEASNCTELICKYFDLSGKPRPFNKWKEQILYVANLISDPTHHPAPIPRITRDTEPAIMPKNLDDFLLKFVNSPELHTIFRKQFIIRYDILKSNGHDIAQMTNLSDGFTISDDNYDEIVKEIQENTSQDANIVSLSVEDFFRVLRHKNSAHADPLDNPKWADEYNLFYTTEALSQTDGDFSSDLLMIAIAEYLVERVNSQLFEKL